MIKVKNLYYYITKDYYALFDVSLSIAKGEHVAILGNNDSGKTTLLRLILGLDTGAKGEILLNNIPIKKVDFKNGLKVLFISSNGAFFENKNCYQNIEKIVKLRKEKPDFIKIMSALQQYGLYSYKDTRVKDLNIFNRVMLQLARASLREDFDLVVIDDVFEKLAFSERQHVLKHIKSLISRKGLTSVIASSDSEIAKALSKRIIKINLGSIESEVET